MVKLVIFDCDGVMFNSKEANRAYYNKLLRHFSLPEMSEAEMNYVHMSSVKEAIEFLFSKHPHISVRDIKEYNKNIDYSEFLPLMQEEPDLKEFLRWLKPDYFTAISTNRSTTMPLLLETYQLDKWFDKVVTAGDTKCPKPSPEALEIILNHFRIAPNEAVFIGDSEVDRLHCQHFNIPLIAFKNKSLQADFHVQNFMAITRLPCFAES